MEDFNPLKPKLVTFLNPYSYLMAHNNSDLFEHFNIIAPDGLLIVIFLNLLRAKPFQIKRFSFDMTSLVPYILSLAVKNNLHTYFIGSHSILIKKTIENLKIEFPELLLAGYRGGYFNDEFERQDFISYVILLNPQIVIIGMGAIVQEKMAVDLRIAGFEGSIYTCGGFLHQSTEKIHYYPTLINLLNLRFFFRIYKEKGFLIRSLKSYPKFCWLMISKKIKQ